MWLYISEVTQPIGNNSRTPKLAHVLVSFYDFARTLVFSAMR